MKRVITVKAFVEQAIKAEAQYNDGLIHRGEFVRKMQGNLQSIAEWDLRDALHTICAYGHTIDSFKAEIENNNLEIDDPE